MNSASQIDYHNFGIRCIPNLIIRVICFSYLSDGSFACPLIRFALYSSQRVHLLPGYPNNASDTILVAFYIQQPLGLFVGNQSVLPSSTLLNIVLKHKSEIGSAIGANISKVEALSGSPSTPRADTLRPVQLTSDKDDWKWIIVGVLGGGLVLLLPVVTIVIIKLSR